MVAHVESFPPSWSSFTDQLHQVLSWRMCELTQWGNMDLLQGKGTNVPLTMRWSLESKLSPQKKLQKLIFQHLSEKQKAKLLYYKNVCFS